MVGTISGDDTIFLATADAARSTRLIDRLQLFPQSRISMPATHPTCARPKPIVLAYSGGLDTSFLVPWLAKTIGGPSSRSRSTLAASMRPRAQTLHERSHALGAIEHHQIDARADYFEQVLRFLIMGNVRRGQLYPLCVGAERVMQAQTIARMARKLGTHIDRARLHGRRQRPGALRSRAAHAGAGSGGARAGARRAFKRQEELEYLQQRKLPVPPFGAAYSINRGLWGVTIGGKETLTSAGSIPDDAWVLSRDAFTQAARAGTPHDLISSRAARWRSTA